jgi:hypothetical protein
MKFLTHEGLATMEIMKLLEVGAETKCTVINLYRINKTVASNGNTLNATILLV